MLELGIVAHSMIIGISLGASESPCIIRPLVAELSFHQFFEGMGLGRCIVQVNFLPYSAKIQTVGMDFYMEYRVDCVFFCGAGRFQE